MKQETQKEKRKHSGKITQCETLEFFLVLNRQLLSVRVSAPQRGAFYERHFNERVKERQ